MGFILLLIIGVVIGFYLAKIIPPKKKMSFPKLQEQETSTTDGQKLEDKIWHEAETDFVFKLNEELALTLEQKKIAQHITESVYNFLGAQSVVLILLNNDTQELRVEYTIGLENDLIGKVFSKKENNISRFVAARKEPLVINDLDKETYFKNINNEGYFKKAFISAPLIFQNNVLGLLCVCDRKSGASFTRQDITFVVNICRVGAIAFQNVQLHEQMRQDYLKTITALAAAVDARDKYTNCHSESVARYALMIAKEMKRRDYEIEVLKNAALLHDIGKIGIPDSILLNEDNITPKEFEQIKLHTIKGEEIVKSLSFLKEASILIRHHHERFDGTGYPDGIKGYDIELGARILAAADSFDAMTSDRPYHKALAYEEGFKELELKKGTQFDPAVVESFIRVFHQNPTIFSE